MLHYDCAELCMAVGSGGERGGGGGTEDGSKYIKGRSLTYAIELHSGMLINTRQLHEWTFPVLPSHLFCQIFRVCLMFVSVHSLH